MRGRRNYGRSPGGTVTVIGWFVAGASVVSSATAVAMSAVALRRAVGQIDAKAAGVETPPAYDRSRIAAVGQEPQTPHVPVLRSVPAVPPENPHAPPTPPLGNPAVRR